MRLFSNLISLFYRLLILLFVYFLLRLLFILFNSEYLTSGGIGNILSVFFYGVRFDIAAIVMTNALFILLHYLPPPHFFKTGWQYLLKSVFYVVNIPFILINCVDLEYFPYSMRRTNSDLFNILTLGEDTFNILPALLADFWHVIILLGVIILLIELLWRKTDMVILQFYGNIPYTGSIVTHNTKIVRKIFLLITVYAGITILFIIGSRGGIQLRPVNMIQAAQTGKPQHSSFILNTTFTILKSFGRMELEEKYFFTEEKCMELVPFVKNNNPVPGDSAGRRINVMIIAMESFSPEYFEPTDSMPSLIPFLDSIRREGFSFTHAYSNGRRTIDGIPAIIAGLPALMFTSYITSAYSGNRINSIASVLGEWGYESAFFHGGTNGTMGFDGFSKMAGFRHYFGRNEYNNDQHFDGTWGIFDDKFMVWTGKKLHDMDKPFFCALLTVSSHHPYALPEEYKQRFETISDPVKKCISYTDLSIRLFFEKISGYDWFDSTLFIFTADHGGPAQRPIYQTRTGMYSIPLFFYMHDSRLKGTSSMTVQQADIFPTVMDFLNCPLPFTSFGSNVLDTNSAHYAVNYYENYYQIISGEYALFFSDTTVVSLFDIRNEPLLRTNLVGNLPDEERKLSDQLKAIIQTYNNRIINNKLAPEYINRNIP